MSGFDDAMRRQTAARQSAQSAQATEMNMRLRAAQAAVPRIQGLLREFVQRLAAAGVRPESVEIGQITKRNLFGTQKRAPQLSPPGYLLGKSHSMHGGVLGAVLVTPAGELFKSSRDHALPGVAANGSIVPITAQSILDGHVYLGSRPVMVSSNGDVGVGDRSEDPKWWKSPEDTLAARAMELIEGRK